MNMSADDNRLHISLRVHDLERSREFYRVLFDQEPDKVKDGYVRFNLTSPPVVLALSDGKKIRKGNRLDHMGIRVESQEILDAARSRMKAIGCWIKEQPDVICCHSRQSKFWVQDPDGLHWEFYLLVDDMMAPQDSVLETNPASETKSDVGSSTPTCGD